MSALNLSVFHTGVVVGQQSIGAHELATVGEVHTGSWLGQDHQGHGIGTEMRAAVLHLAFAGLSAAEATSGAFEDNPASAAVSRTLGYRPDGITRRVVRGKLATDQRMRLTRADWERHRSIAVTVDGLAPRLRMFGAAAGWSEHNVRSGFRCDGMAPEPRARPGADTLVRLRGNA